MKKTIDVHDFHEAFHTCDRTGNFSYEARGALFDYLEELEEETRQEFELDVIALCCEYSEESFADVAANYALDVSGLDADEAREAILDYLNDETSVVWHDDDSVLYAQF